MPIKIIDFWGGIRSYAKIGTRPDSAPIPTDDEVRATRARIKEMQAAIRADNAALRLAKADRLKALRASKRALEPSRFDDDRRTDWTTGSPARFRTPYGKNV